MHNEGVEYVLNKLDDESFSIFETPPFSRYQKIINYASEYAHFYMFSYLPEAQQNFEANYNFSISDPNIDSLYQSAIYDYFIGMKYSNDMTLSYCGNIYLNRISNLLAQEEYTQQTEVELDSIF
ncbi:MAG: hypothetical protein IJ834_06945 [Paludibacteraceae bacterium]|nr:hypothetical protein [Paludibacteraceae bacterium]